MKKKYSILVMIVVVFFLIIIGINLLKKKSEPVNWDGGRNNDIAIIADGWSKPVLVGINTPDMEDSSFISLDGDVLYFMHYPGDLSTSPNPDVVGTYKSEKPF